MGWISAIQPNGKICVLSTVVDNIIYDNLSEEESERHIKWMRNNGGNFEQIKDGLYPDDENHIENVREWLKSVGDPDWDKFNYDLPKY